MNKLNNGIKVFTGRDATYKDRENLVPSTLQILRGHFEGPRKSNNGKTIVTAALARVTNLQETYAGQISALIDHRRFDFPHFASNEDGRKFLHLRFGHDKSEIGTVVAGRVISANKPQSSRRLFMLGFLRASANDKTENLEKLMGL